MIDFEKKLIIFGGKSEPIREWKVYFRSPFGLHETLDEAIDRLKKSDLDVQITIAAVPAAIGETLTEMLG